MRYVFLACLLLFPAIASSAEPIRLESEGMLGKYWVFDADTSFALMEQAGTKTDVPPDVARKAGDWRHVFAVLIDHRGVAVSAECIECEAGDPVVPPLQYALLLQRFVPGPDNPERRPVEVPMLMSLIPGR